MPSPSSRSRLRSDSASSTGSRNDLFSTSYNSGPVPRPPKPLNLDTLPSTGGSGGDGRGVGVESGNWATTMSNKTGKIGSNSSQVSRSRMGGDKSPSSTKGGPSRTTSPTRTPYIYTSDSPTSKTANFFSSTMNSPQPPSSGRLAPPSNLNRLGPAPILTSRAITSLSADDSGMEIPGAGKKGMSPISPIPLSPVTPPPIPSSSNVVEVDTNDLDDRRSTLGTGRYARVVRGRYRYRKGEGSGVAGGDGSVEETGEEGWSDCALKVPLSDDVLSKGMIEKEARILAHLHELLETPQRFASLDNNVDINRLAPRNLEKGKDRIVRYIGLQQLSGLSSWGRKGKTSAHGSLIVRKPCSDSRHSRFISDGTPLRTMGSDRQDINHPARIAEFATHISLHGDEESTSLPCLILEYIPRALSTWLEEGNRRWMGPERWRDWARELAEAVGWCHEKGVLHGDIKPGNVLIDDYDHLRLVDFGSSLMLSSVATPLSPVTLPTMLSLQSTSPNLLSFDLGTAPYSAPELFADTTIVSFPSDIFSLGVTLWQLLTFRTPYAGKRTVETMLGVRRGMFWEIHERDRIARMSGGERTMAEPETTAAGVRRSGSLRIPGRERMHKQQLISDLHRMSSRSSESLAQLPSLIEQRLVGQPGAERIPVMDTARTYQDGAPAMWFPDEEDIVEEETRSLLRSMVHPDAEVRPTARDVLDILCN